MFEDIEWSYLKEIFCKVEWSVKLKRLLRATWIEVRGVPLHAWNDISLKRIAKIWGNFEAWGENANRVPNSERATVLITMGYSRRIDETILVEIGSETHEINILELGFKDDIVDPLTQATNAKAPIKPQSEDSLESCLEQKHMSNSGKEMSKGDSPFQKLNSRQGEWESTNVGSPAQIVGQECSIENVRDGDNDLGLPAKSDSEFHVKKTRTAKKFGSLWELQDMKLSKYDKKKRDRTSRRKKIIKENLQDSKLSDCNKNTGARENFGLKIKGSEEVAEIRKLWPDDEFDFKAVEAVKIVSCTVAEQVTLSNELYVLNVNDSTHWLMGGVFNTTRNRSEQSSESFKLTVLVAAESMSIRCGGSLVWRRVNLERFS
ncbi:hypothetical protein GQ457_09G026020 [Hibiscus cannabinus]